MYLAWWIIIYSNNFCYSGQIELTEFQACMPLPKGYFIDGLIATLPSGLSELPSVQMKVIDSLEDIKWGFEKVPCK